jgi:hypothetical protein
VARVRVRLTFVPDLVREPVIHRVAKTHHLVPNIRKARVTETAGEVILDFTGAADDLARGLAWLAGQGVQVARLDG